MPDTTKDNSGKETEKDRKVDKATKPCQTKSKPPNHNKLQWLKGEGPQTD